MRFAVMTTTFRDDSGSVVAEQRTTVVETAKPPERSIRVTDATTEAPSVPAVGDERAPRTFGPITRTDIVRYAGASGDFNPIHHDEPFAVSVGFPSVFSIGMFQAALLATYATDWLGADTIRRYTVRFKEQVWPGDELTCRGTVTGVEAAGDDGTAVDVELLCTRQTGGVAIAGTARFVLGTGVAA